jgi:hypothetical protein
VVKTQFFEFFYFGFSFSFSEYFVSVEVADEFKSILNEFADFCFCFADFAYVVYSALEERFF